MGYMLAYSNYSIYADAELITCVINFGIPNSELAV